jgi:uncharacterized protein (TIGR01244 family)
VDFRTLEDGMLVAGQIRPDDLRTAAERGVTMIVNNRPEGEEPGQPSGAALEAAAGELGLEYQHIPVSGGFSEAQVEAMAKALEASKGPVLAFCKSGTRSTFLWALAKALQGAEPEELARKAAEAGYDLSPILGYLRR